MNCLRHRFTAYLIVVVVLLASGCRKAECPADAATSSRTEAVSEDASVAVSSPYLEAAIREVVGQELRLVRLAGPSMCPGHFDMRPSQIDAMSRCKLLVRFDFQQALDRKLRTDSCRVTPITVRGGLCLPDTYVAACRQVADCLATADCLKPSKADVQLAKLTKRMTSLREEVLQKIDVAKLRDVPVLASGHQADFCRWLGLRLVAEISGADTSGIRSLDDAIKAGDAATVRIVIANEPEGRRTADALADRLNAKVVVFANFPEPDQELAFDNLIRRNVTALLDVGRACEKNP